ncbi:MAG: hypothetical protein JNJ73_11690 [Hyphomonadaceae bacterium]|nr:hypothetical protein [Hyphomonadaceae bacterium]
MRQGRHGSVTAKAREIVVLLLALLVVFLVVNIAHFRYLRVHVVMFAALMDAVAALALTMAGYWLVRRAHTPLLRTELALTGMLGAALLALYAVMGPAVIDRSLSIYIVEKVNQRGGEISVASVPAIFVEEYMPEYRLVDVRLTEQLRAGTLVLDRGCLKLTAAGRRLVAFTTLYRHTLLPRRRVLMGETTDALTDPFRDSKQRVDTTCPAAPGTEG